MSKRFENLKVGDTVFVVHQKRRHEKEDRSHPSKVVKVGRKYGVLSYYGDARFDLITGQSVHSDCNARANSFGFDVYWSEQDWLELEHRRKEFRRLAERIVSPHSSRHIVDLPHDAVVAIHKILDGTLGQERKDGE